MGGRARDGNRGHEEGSSVLPDRMRVIDCDVHNVVPSMESLHPHLPQHWVEFLTYSQYGGPRYSAYLTSGPAGPRPDSILSNGHPPGSDVSVTRQVMDRWGIDLAILNCAYFVETVRMPDLAATLARAVNDWQIQAWLELEPRLRGSVVVPSHYPDLAAQEIDRVGGHPGFVQVFLPVRSDAPYGNRRFWPMHEAAVRQGLLLAIHFGGAPGFPPNPAGWPSYYLEESVTMANAFQAQAISLVIEGVFDRFPSLKVVLLEGGFAWLPSMMWRLDKDWKGVQRQVPWVRRPPSDYIRQHFRLSIQPYDGPGTTDELLALVDQMGSEDLLLFSTDYPHWQFDDYQEALPVPLPEGLARKIRVENARSFYGL